MDLKSPKIQIDQLHIKSGTIYVVRDDLLQGGTKERAARPFLKDKEREGFQEFVYASPFSGFAQVALSSTCQQLNLSCRIFCEKDQSQNLSERIPHEFSRLAVSYGARLNLTDSLEEAEVKAHTYCTEKSDRLKIPLGFDCYEYKCHLKRALSEQWEHLVTTLKVSPSVLWLPVGSGTLGTVFREFLPDSTLIKCVNVRVLKESDPRIRALSKRSGIIFYKAPELFSERVHNKPPVPSNVFYDAKLWQFIYEEGGNGDVWWNVAR